MFDENVIFDIIKNNIEDKTIEIKKNSNLTEDLGIDSFNLLMIVNDFEDEFDISIDEEDFGDLVIVDDIIEALKIRLKLNEN